ncbi:MAG: hypothetical protein IIU22_03855, partial [Firmicutes bacterium]|nr:hypothetical protein [Bacillota bacterium]
MSLLSFKLLVDTSEGVETVKGDTELSKGMIRIACEAPKGHIRELSAETVIDIDGDEKIFV